jgi:hypothetical protein
LQGVTGVPVSVGEKERGFIPVGVTTSVAKEPAETQTGEEKPPASSTQETATGTVNVTSNPDGADGYADTEGDPGHGAFNPTFTEVEHQPREADDFIESEREFRATFATLLGSWRLAGGG